MDGGPMLYERIDMRRPPYGTQINAICVSSNDPLVTCSCSFHGGAQNPAASSWDLRSAIRRGLDVSSCGALEDNCYLAPSCKNAFGFHPQLP